MDRGAWRAAVHGVAQGQTRLKGLSRRPKDHILEPCDGEKPWRGRVSPAMLRGCGEEGAGNEQPRRWQENQG